MSNTWGPAYSKELQTESAATRKCLERIPETLYEYKPHPKSMALGSLTMLVAEIPNWINVMIEKGEIDLATYQHFKLGTTTELLEQYDRGVEKATALLSKTTDKDLEKIFSLKSKGQLLFSSSLLENISSTINHWVHHRGQLSVYMRLNDIAVPSIYGPSADEPGF